MSESFSPDRQAFAAFYDTYARKVWGIMLAANLPTPQAEAILTNTFVRAWQQSDVPTSTEKQVLTRLLGLACQEGLPIDCLRAILKANVRQPDSDRSGLTPVR